MTAQDDLFAALAAELAAGFSAVPDKPDETAQSTLCALWFLAAGDPRPVRRAVPPLPPLSPTQAAGLRALLGRRLAGEPLAYLLGLQDFMGVELEAAPGALIPRRETEIVGRAALDALAALDREDPDLLDLCTGCGNIAAVLALRSRRSRVVATDLEAEALVVAARNMRRHGLEGRVELRAGDLFGALDGMAAPRRFDLISCNPPYIPTRHATQMPANVGGGEPVAAFDGGPFGLSIVLRLIREAPSYLADGGWLCFEIGAGQHGIVESRLKQQGGYAQPLRHADEAGVIRAFQVRWNAAAPL